MTSLVTFPTLILLYFSLIFQLNWTPPEHCSPPSSLPANDRIFCPWAWHPAQGSVSASSNWWFPPLHWSIFAYSDRWSPEDVRSCSCWDFCCRKNLDLSSSYWLVPSLCPILTSCHVLMSSTLAKAGCGHFNPFCLIFPSATWFLWPSRPVCSWAASSIHKSWGSRYCSSCSPQRALSWCPS